MPGLGHIGEAKIVVDKSVTPVQQTDIKKKVMELQEEEIINKAVEPCYRVD